MLNQYIILFILIPILGLISSSFFDNKRENNIYTITITVLIIQLLCIFTFIIFWILGDVPVLFYKGYEVYKSEDFILAINFYFDKITAFYAIIASVITLIICKFSRTYMHRDKGFKRFFNNILFFYVGIILIIFAGNFETIFIGWEIIGLSSFLLISFYRDRYLPVKNAIKVLSFFRLADFLLLTSIWICHHLFKRSITFNEMSDLQNQHKTIIENSIYQLIIPLLFLFVAIIKSAQFPFSSWLPRAMEGPTTSSAIFYGSLSVHIGVFLLLRTSPLWENNTVFIAIVICFGLLTSLIANSIASVQSTVKTQIAYSSIAQIGLIFVEVAMGWHLLSLIHFAGNAFFRTYQLLVSPSVLSYLIHDQFFNFIRPNNKIKTNFYGKIKMTIYVLSIKEWNLDWIMYKCLWNPIKKTGNIFSFIGKKWVIYFLTPVFIFSLYLVYHKENISIFIIDILPSLFAFFALIMVLKAFTERKNAIIGLIYIVFNHLFISLSIGFNENFDFYQIHLYLSGIIISGIFAYLVLRRLISLNESISLNTFHGHSKIYPNLSFVFLILCLILAAFPISTTFIGEEFILGHIHLNQYILIITISFSLILDGLTVLRIYSRLFNGPNYKSNHEIAYRSS
jgi:NADH-quinone oxidoreductase subunit L